MTGLIGQSIGRYHILEKLGEGGMANVYKAYDTRLERDVAVKIIRMDQFSPAMLEMILKRFEREAKALAKLSHPNIVGVIDYGEHQGMPYLVMVYLPGGTLKEKLGRQIPWAEAARLLLPVAHALAYAHRQGVIHRDVKPNNILMAHSGDPMLTDFGIAKLLDISDSQSLTGSGVGIGTPEYMAPEQALGQEIDARVDVYALGIVFYEMVTGKKPFTADTPLAVVLKHISDPLPRPSGYVPDLPEAVEHVLIKALAKKPEDRYADMDGLAAVLEDLSTGQSMIKSGAPKGIELSAQADISHPGLAALEPSEYETAEKASHEQAERKATEKTAREQAEREAAEKTAREQAEREAAEKAAIEQAERDETLTPAWQPPVPVKTVATAPQKRTLPVWVKYSPFIMVLLVVLLGWLFQSNMAQLFPSPTITPRNTSTPTTPPTQTITPSLTTTLTLAPTSTQTPTTTPDAATQLLMEAFSYIKSSKPAYTFTFTQASSWNFNNFPENAKMSNGELVVKSGSRNNPKDPTDHWNAATIRLFTSHAIAVSFDFRIEGVGGQFTHCGYELLSSQSNGNIVLRNMYLFMPGGKVNLEQTNNNLSFPTVTGGKSDSDFAQNNSATIILLDTNSVIYVNEEMVLIYKDPKTIVDFKDISLSANGTSDGLICYFDNLKIWNLGHFLESQK